MAVFQSSIAVGRSYNLPRELLVGGDVQLHLNNEQRLAAASVLKSAGFSSAWIYDFDDQSEIVFMVPKEEGDFTSLEQSASTHEVVVELMKVLSFVKVWVTPVREDVSKTLLY